MRKLLNIAIGGVLAATALAAMPAAAGAALSQEAAVSLKAASGSLAPKGANYVKLNAYLSTRDDASTRPQLKANPVGKVVIAFPPGTVVNPRSTTGCHMNQYSAVSKLKATCPKALIGMGWAFVNTGDPGATARAQLTDISGAPNAPAACAADDATQYTRTWSAAGTPDCVPLGHIWNRVYAYQGAIINGKYNHAAVLFASDNAVAGIAFGGTTRTNTLTVPIPALNGNGSGAGELPFGWVLSDFKLDITKPNYLKAGACTSSKVWTTKTTISYSNFKGEPVGPAPASKVISTKSVCRR